MHIFGISDIHLEFRPEDNDFSFTSKWPAADVLVLAGDIGSPIQRYQQYKRFLEHVKRTYQTVVFISGNHEYYGCNYDRDNVIRLLQTLADSTGCHFLHRDSIVVNSVRFIGATLWSIIRSHESINDFSQGVFIEQLDYVQEFGRDSEFIQHCLKDTDIPTVVITHHLPSRRLIHDRFRHFDNSSCRVAKYEALDIWVYTRIRRHYLR
uniref:Calcineurin-like phosphoesterase domain-containing protein n=1 Tax=viral metagenome TaxID=1070528 RepID=A0A6C0CNF9_9ZZZZ